MVELILTPNVQQNCEAWPCFGDVGEILLRPHPEVNAALGCELFQQTRDLKVRRFVRDQVVRIEESWIL